MEAKSMKKSHFLLILFIILVIGTAIRLFDLADAPLDFHPTRQLHSALMARGMFYQLQGVDSWQAQRAIEQWKLEGLIEPPIMEWLSAFGYKLIGEVDLQIPRLIAITFWILAGITLLSSAVRLTNRKAALVGLAFFLCYPYGVIASRSFQPESLLVLFLSLFMMALLAWNKQRDWRWAVLVGLFAGLAIWIKTVAAFFVAGMWLAWLISEDHWRTFYKNGKLWVAFLLTVLPYTLYLLYGLFIDKSYQGQFSLRFFPGLWTDVAFYLRWLSNLRRVVGIEWLIMGLLGCLLVERKTQRNMLIGAWVGYVILGFTLPHHISTHDYYHLPLLLFVAVGVSNLAALLFTWISARKPLVRVVSVILLVVLFAVFLMDVRSEMKKVNYSDEIAFWEMMGARFDPDDRVVALSQDYGNRLAYWGWITPRNWPSLDDIALRQEAGQELSLADYFQDYTQGFDYFLVTDMVEFARQPQVADWLQANFEQISADDAYLLYVLRAEKE